MLVNDPVTVVDQLYIVVNDPVTVVAHKITWLETKSEFCKILLVRCLVENTGTMCEGRSHTELSTTSGVTGGTIFPSHHYH